MGYALQSLSHHEIWLPHLLRFSYCKGCSCLPLQNTGSKVVIWQRPKSYSKVLKLRTIKESDTFLDLQLCGGFSGSRCNTARPTLCCYLSNLKASTTSSTKKPMTTCNGVGKPTYPFLTSWSTLLDHQDLSLTTYPSSITSKNYTVQPNERSSKRKKNHNNTDFEDSESDNSTSDSEDNADNQRNNSTKQDLYSNYVYRKTFPCVCRMNFKPDAGYAWYLRLLRHHIPSSSWENIRTVNGILHDTHNKAARQRGLLRGTIVNRTCGIHKSLYV